jgi:hypothetical protein
MTRNRGRPTLRELSSANPTQEEKKKLAHTAYNYEGSPIVTAILGAVTIEIELDTLLRLRFPKCDDSLWASMVGDHGPFNTFDQKITMAFAFRIFDEATKDNIKIIKNIRNVFAHAKKLVDFDDPLISAEIKKIKVPGYSKRFHLKVRKGNHYPSKYAYVMLCIIVTTMLIRKRGNSLSAKNRRLVRKRQQQFSPFASLLAMSAEPKPDVPSGGLLSGLLSSPLSQSAGLSSLVPGSSLSGLSLANLTLAELGKLNKK